MIIKITISIKDKNLPSLCLPPALCREADRRCELNGTPCTSWSCALHAYNYCDYCGDLGDHGADLGDLGDRCDDGKAA